MARSLILGTAGHIDHGKTALVGALTGVDTDRLAEEKERGITIDLGFAEFRGQIGDEAISLGVVDVPGHEGFVRNMLAGATGMDVVLLVVAADEGVMPQTREHLAILTLLGVDRVVVALTKADLVEPEWLELAAEEVREILEETPFADAPILPTSATTGQGIEELGAALLERAAGVSQHRHDPDDLLQLPIDRVFSVKGTGTVVTGTLWSGQLSVGDTVRILPAGGAGRGGTVREARVRGLQLHGQEVQTARAGTRTAVALTGDAIDTEQLERGQCLVRHSGWAESSMLTVRLRVVQDTGWGVEHGQRVRVHLGTTEVMARCIDLETVEDRSVDPGAPPTDPRWMQLRLESPVCARVGQRVVLRSYSPMTTIAGGEIAEGWPPKRRRGEGASSGEGRAESAAPRAARLSARLAPEPIDRVRSALESAAGTGLPADQLPIRTGLPPAVTTAALEALQAEGALVAPVGQAFAASVVEARAERIREVVDRVHAEEAFRPGAGVAELRAGAPAGDAPALADAVIAHEVAAGRLELERGVVRRPGFTPELSPEQDALRSRMSRIWADAGLEPPRLDDLPAEVRGDPAFLVLLRAMVAEGTLIELEADLFIQQEALSQAVVRIRDELSGRDGLGPADFRGPMPVTRRHLLPILAYLDRTGVTRFDGSNRAVVSEGSAEPD